MKTLIIPNDHISKVCDLLNQFIGDVTSKNLFTGYGLFHKEKDMLEEWNVASWPRSTIFGFEHLSAAAGRMRQEMYIF